MQRHIQPSIFQPLTAPNAGPAPTAMVSNRTYWPVVAVIFVIALIVRVPTLTQPWVGVHNAWGGAYYSNVARNFDRYGLDTRLAPIVNTGVVEPVEFTGAQALAMDAQASHILVLRNGTVWTWGTNSFGQLGDGTSVAWGASW